MPNSQSNGNGSQPSFLYVEDDMLSRKVMEVLIKTVLGYTDLAIFEDSQNFMDRVRTLPHPPSVIFLDVQMGPHNGYEMLRMLRGDLQHRDSTIIAMTANVMAHDVEQLKQAGFSGLVGKPIIKEVFPELMERILVGESVWYIP
jgi:two-component system cell cycle response regulator DivK